MTKVKPVVVNFTLLPEVKQFYQELAAKDQKPLTGWIREALDSYVREQMGVVGYKNRHKAKTDAEWQSEHNISVAEWQAREAALEALPD